MPVANEQDVRQVLRDFEGRLRDVLNGALEDWRETPNKARWRFTRTRANLVFEFIIERAFKEFDGDPDIRVLLKGQTVQFLFKDRVLLRFKQGNALGVGGNVETQAVLDFVDPQLSIPGLPEVHRVEVVHMWDGLATRFSEVAVVARDRLKRVWSYPLDGRPSADVVPLPVRGGPLVSPPEVTPRRPTEEAEDEE